MCEDQIPPNDVRERVQTLIDLVLDVDAVGDSDLLVHKALADRRLRIFDLDKI